MFLRFSGHELLRGFSLVLHLDLALRCLFSTIVGVLQHWLLCYYLETIIISPEGRDQSVPPLTSWPKLCKAERYSPQSGRMRIFHAAVCTVRREQFNFCHSCHMPLYITPPTAPSLFSCSQPASCSVKDRPPYIAEGQVFNCIMQSRSNPLPSVLWLP